MSASFVLLRHNAEAASAQARANAPLAGPGAFCEEAAAFAALVRARGPMPLEMHVCYAIAPDAPGRARAGRPEI